MPGPPDQLTVLKALGDETRFAMYSELARSTAALSAQDLAERLGLHANTVRLHLERLREAGLVDVEPVHRGTVGRPQHLYFLADGAPALTGSTNGQWLDTHVSLDSLAVYGCSASIETMAVTAGDVEDRLDGVMSTPRFLRETAGARPLFV